MCHGKRNTRAKHGFNLVPPDLVLDVIVVFPKLFTV